MKFSALQIYVCWMEALSTDERLPPHISDLFSFYCLHTSGAKSLGTCLCHASTSGPVPWCQVSQHSKNIPGSYYDLLATITLHGKNCEWHWTQTKYMFFVSWSKNTGKPSNVTPHKKADTKVLRNGGLNFLLLQILQDLKTLLNDYYTIRSSQELGRTLWKWRFWNLSFIIVIIGPSWFELEVYEWSLWEFSLIN